MVHWLPARAVINGNRVTRESRKKRKQRNPQEQEITSHQLLPFRIYRLNERDLLSSAHILHLVLPPYGGLVIGERLIIDTLLTIVSVRERALIDLFINFLGNVRKQFVIICSRLFCDRKYKTENLFRSKKMYICRIL